MNYKLFALIFLLSGCSATGLMYGELPKANLNNRSEIIIYREGKISASGSSFCTLVNGNPLGILKNGGFIRAFVEPGKNVISMPFDDNLVIEVETTAENTTYIEFTVGLAGMGVIPIGTITSVSMSWNMAMITRDFEYSKEKLTKLRESTYSTTCKK